MNVYDFDNTIYDGESGLDLFRFYLRRHPDLLRLAPTVIRAFMRYKRHKVTLEEAIRAYLPYVEDFLLRIEDPAGDMREFWDLHQHKIKPFYQALQREDDLIISASPEQEIAEICGRLGIKHWLGTVIDEDTRRITHVNFRENKLKYFREKYPDERIDTLFTDSYNDKWLMREAAHVLLVRGNQFEAIK